MLKNGALHNRRRNLSLPRLINRGLADLKSALARAVVWGYLATNPLAKVTPLKVDKSAEVRYLSPDEHKRLVAALAQRDERIKAERERANAWRRSRGYLEMQEARP